MGCTIASEQTVHLNGQNFKSNNLKFQQSNGSKQIDKSDQKFGNEKKTPLETLTPKDKNELNYQELMARILRHYKNFTPKSSEKNPQTSVEWLKQGIRDMFKELLKEKLKDANEQKISIKQCKIEISQQILKMQIEVMKEAVKTLNFEECLNFYQGMDQFLKTLCGFLKTKYPRSQTLEAGQLSKVFKEFDATEELDYDMLKNAGFSFLSSKEVDIFKTIKLFLNRIIDQLELNYPRFKSIIQEIDDNFKIGRKISENTAKYYLLDSGTLSVKSTQIVRVLIKWMQELNDFVSKPSNKLGNMNSEYKFAKFSEREQMVKFIRCNQSEIDENMLSQVLSEISEQKQNLKSIQKQIEKEFKSFNINMFKTFNQIQKYQSQVQNFEAQIIKYSYFNYDFITWMIEQKLINVIKALVQIGQKHQTKNGSLDLIKFKVNDLMRCQYLGNKKQIVSIFQKFKQLQVQGKIQIVKIKNRFHTFLGDAMIFFKIKQSFLICQCQLVLYEDTNKNDSKKAKNIESINHFLYEIERSPFGIMGQCSAFLRSKSQTVSTYCSKIVMTLKSTFSVDQCKKNHLKEEKIGEENRKPFVCSLCVKFYPKFSNFLRLHSCDICGIILCNNCLNLNFEISSQQINDTMIKRFREYFYQKQKYLKASEQQLISKVQQVGFLADLFEKESVKFIDIFQSTKIKIQSIINYFRKKEENNIKYLGFQSIQKQKFVLVTLRANQVRFKCYQIDHEKGDISNVFQKLEKYEKHEFFCINKFDLLFRFKKLVYNDFEERIFFESNQVYACKTILQNGLYIFDGQSKSQIINRFQKSDDLQKQRCALGSSPILDSQDFKIDFIVDVYRQDKRSKQEGWLKKYFDQLPDLNQFRKNIRLPVQKIVTQELLFIKQLDWKSSIKTINFRKNQIRDISIVLQNCINLQRIYLDLNRISNIKFPCNLPYFKELSAQNCDLQRIQNLKHISSVEVMNVSHNQIYQISLQSLQNQKIANTDEAPSSQVGRSEVITIKNKQQQLTNKQSDENSGQKTKKINYDTDKTEKLYEFNFLVKLNVSDNNLQNIDFLGNCICPNLSQLQIKNNKIIRIPRLSTPKLSEVDLRLNRIQSIQNFGKSQCFLTLQSLSLSKLVLLNFPVLSQNLKIFRYESSQLTDDALIAILDGVQMINLEELSLSNNKLKYLPKIKSYPNLKRLYLDDNLIEEKPDSQKFQDLKCLDKLWITLNYQSTDLFNSAKFKLIQMIKDPKRNLVIWKHNKDMIIDYNSTKNIVNSFECLPRRQYLTYLLKDEETINLAYFKSHQSNFYFLKINYKRLNLLDFVQYDWRTLESIQFTNDSLTDEAWRILVRHSNLFPNLKFIDFSNNSIRTILYGDLQSFLSVKLRTFKKISFLKNAISNESKNFLKNFKQSNPYIQVLY